MMQKQVNLLVFIVSFFLLSCGGTVIPTNPIQEMKTEFEAKEAYTIVLYDMDLVDGVYKHQYKVFDVIGGKKAEISTTDWKDVGDDFFLLHEDDLGMEIFSKMEDGTYNHLITPPGFTHFVGHTNFGQWTTFGGLLEDTAAVWQFDVNNENAMLVESELVLSGLNITKGEYEGYKDRYYLNRPFYGTHYNTDTTKYGTRSHHWLIMRPFFYTRKRQKQNFNKPYDGAFSYENRGGGGFGK